MAKRVVSSAHTELGACVVARSEDKVQVEKKGGTRCMQLTWSYLLRLFPLVLAHKTHSVAFHRNDRNTGHGEEQYHVELDMQR